MKTLEHALVALLAVALLPAAVLAQTNATSMHLPSCSIARHSERRIFSTIAETVVFYVPRFAHMQKVQDVDYVEYHVRYGPKEEKVWLKFMFGRLVGGHSPDDLGNSTIHWTSHKLRCNQDEGGTDWRGTNGDGRRWRHVSIPFGFAAYRSVAPKAAQYFDKILDTMCSGSCRTCK
jgi:hypothetical protein